MQSYIDRSKEIFQNELSIQNRSELESFIFSNITKLLDQKIEEFKITFLKEIEEFIIKKRELDKEIIIQLLTEEIDNITSTPEIGQLLSDFLLYLFTSKRF